MSVGFLVCILGMLVLMVLGLPVAFSMISAAVLYLLVTSQDLALAGEQVLAGLYDSYVLLAVPLFIVSANIMNVGDISMRLLRFCSACVGRFSGGLGHVNIFSSLVFSGMSGSAVADAAGIGKIITEMMCKDNRYSKAYAAALTAASATIGPIVPPSIPMMLYAVVSNQSIGYLFLGGIIPGIFIAFVLMIVNFIIAKKRKIAREEAVKLREVPRITFQAFPALLMPLILLYGIYSGKTTPTEAAAIAAAYALLVSALLYKSITVSNLYQVFASAARTTSSVGLVIGGAFVLNYVVASENIPRQIEALFSGLNLSPLGFILAVNVLILVLGAFFDATTIILIVLPLFIPTCQALGIDLIYFGVVAVINCMLGLITPPYGVLLFVINAVTGVPLREIISEIWIFLLVLLIALLVLILFPDIILWLPRLAGYTY